jgi:hypothetical protein
MRVLLPIPKWQWRTPSAAQQKDIFGNENQTRFRICARLHDGHVLWCGWFDDRDDFDAFLWALVNNTLRFDRELWRLPAPWWHPDFNYPDIFYDFTVTKFITSTSASNQTDTIPSDWNTINNNVDLIGSGGSGGAAFSTTLTRVAAGGGAGGWSQQVNISVAPGGTVTFFLNAGGSGVTASTGTAATGNLGTDTWYNGTALIGSSVGAKGGTGGGAQIAASTTAVGGVGGALASGVGSSRSSGGSGGSCSSANAIGVASGGGGAGGGSGSGNSSATLLTQTVAIANAGGSGDAGAGGGAGAGNTGGTPGGVGGNGTEYDASHGSGGGGGGAETASSVTGGSGGNYGGGGGGASGTAATVLSGAGIQGLIIRQYVPSTAFTFSIINVG